MIHEDLQSCREQLDNILIKAKPIFDLKYLIFEIRNDIRKLKKNIESIVVNHPEMCSSGCPDSDICSEQVNGKCPKIKRDTTSLFYGDNSIFTIEYLIGSCN